MQSNDVLLEKLIENVPVRNLRCDYINVGDGCWRLVVIGGTHRVIYNIGNTRGGGDRVINIGVQTGIILTLRFTLLFQFIFNQ